MSEELPQITPEILSGLADWAVSQGKGRTLFQLQLDVRNAIKSGHPLLGGAVFRKPKGRKIADAVFAASQRQFKATKENHERRMNELLSEAVKTPTPVNTATAAAGQAVREGHVENHLDELNKTACSRCQSRQLALWSNNTEQLCEKCFNPGNSRLHRASSSFRLLFCPHLLPDGTWVSKSTLSFSVLREFIEKCLRPSTASNLTEALVSSPESIRLLIDLLESKMVTAHDNPAFRARSEEINRLRQSISQLYQEVISLNQSVRELEQTRSQERGLAALNILIAKRGELKSRASAKEVEGANLAKRVERIEKRLYSSLDSHPLKVQRHAVDRLRREFAQWRKGELEFEIKSPIHRVYWELLKPSGDSWREIVRHYEYLQRVHHERYELERLKQIHDLHPDVIYIGLASFEGYVVFVFKKGDVAVLDCPKVGNALYVMDASKWKFFSQLSKTELLSHHQDEVRRIIHNRGWFRELEHMLGRQRRFAL